MANASGDTGKSKGGLGLFLGVLIGTAVGSIGIDLARGDSVDLVRLLVVLAGTAVGGGIVVLLKRK